MLKKVLSGALVSFLLGAAGCGATAAPASSPSHSAAASTSTAAPAAQRSTAKRSVTLLLDWAAEGYQAPFYLGVAKGFYRQAGLGDVKIVAGKGSVSTTEQIGHGNYDFGFADAEAAALGIGKGIPVGVVADYTQNSPLALITLKKAGIKTPADLVGKAIGSAPGSSTYTLLPAFLAANHLSSKQVKIQTMATDALVGALESGKVAAITNYDILMMPLLDASGYPASELSWAKWNLPGLSLGLIVNNAFVKAHPKTVAAFVAASDRAWAYTNAHPQEAIAAEQKIAGKLPPGAVGSLKLAIAEEHTPNTAGKPVGWMSPADWQATLSLLKQRMGLTSSDPASHYYTDRYVNAAGGTVG